MHIHIVAGGPFEYIPPLEQEASQDDILWVGVDRGRFFTRTRHHACQGFW